MAVQDLSGALIAFRSALAGDSELTAKLGSDPAGGVSIYNEFPEIQVNFPILILTIQGVSSQIQLDGPGLYRMVPQLDIFVIDSWQAWDIYGILEDNWSIPNSRAGAITSANHTITQINWTTMIEVGKYILTDTEEMIQQFSVDFRLRVRRKQ